MVNDKYKYMKGFLFIGLSLFVLLFYSAAYKSTFNTDGKLFGLNFNIMAYMISLAASFVVYFLIISVYKNFDIKVNKNIMSLIFFAAILFAIWFIYQVYAKETSLFAGNELPQFFVRENMNHAVFTILMLILIAGVLIVTSSTEMESKYFRIIFSLQLAFLCAIFTYAPNIFKNPAWGLHHIHAYTNSIVNVAHFKPYDDIRSAIYGHYGLIYTPFVKLFGNNLFAISITISLFTFIAYMSVFYTASKLIKKNIHFGVIAAAIASLSVTTYGSGQYYQLMPHRLIFPFLTIGFITRQIKTNKLTDKKRDIFEYVFGICAVIFNIETGLVSLLTLSAYHIFEERGDLKAKFKRIFRYIIYCVACVVSAYLIVNIYNLIAGGTWNSVSTFIYPIGSSDYDMFSVLRTPLPDIYAGYILHIIVFLFSGFEAVYRLWSKDLDEDEKNEERLLCLAIAVSGITSLTYFINRTAAGSVAISHIQFILLLGFYAQRVLLTGKNELKNIAKAPEKMFSVSMSCIAFILVAWFAIEGIFGIGNTINNRIKNGWNIASLKTSIETLESRVPDDTLAFGKGMPEVYFQMGRDPKIAITDWSDMTKYSIEETQRLVNESDSFVMMDDAEFTVPADFEAVDKIVTGDFSCTYYKRR